MRPAQVAEKLPTVIFGILQFLPRNSERADGTDTGSITLTHPSISMGFATRCKFSGDVGAGIGGHSDTRGGSPASGGEHSLGEGTRRGVSRQPAGRGRSFAGSGVVCHHGAFQRVCQAWPNSVFVGTLIVEVLM